jgi:hypothetical protein
MINSVKAKLISGTDFSYNNIGNNYTFYLLSYFSYGSGGSSPKITLVQSFKSHDTVFIKALYDTRGTWAAMGSMNYDSIKYTNSFSDVHYINVSSNAIRNIIDEFHTDTLWNLYDTTFKISTSGITNIPNNNESWSIYPNPASNVLHLPLKDWDHLLIYNEMGQVLFRHSKSALKNELIDISMLHNGLYFICFYDDYKNRLGATLFFKQND